ncbi:DUF2442 domain-containing protein [candidate division KSB1 bacterium]|nr:DUF2442 domain-containing protein [candidate division KSB1 bacterium]
MNTLTIDMQALRAQGVSVSANALSVDLTDGRTITVPLAWYPRLLHGTAKERNHWRLIGNGEGIHWPELDEDLSVEGIVLGRPSAESSRSFQRWLEQRASKNKRPSQSKLRTSRNAKTAAKV